MLGFNLLGLHHYDRDNAHEYKWHIAVKHTGFLAQGKHFFSETWNFLHFTLKSYHGLWNVRLFFFFPLSVNMVSAEISQLVVKEPYSETSPKTTSQKGLNP